MLALVSGDVECVQVLVGAGATSGATELTMAHRMHGDEGGAALAALLN